jgi:uncharacterized membrane protein
VALQTDVTLGRIVALDLARSAALVAMASYHFTYDLALFGLIPPDVPVTGAFAVYARCIAGSFLFLAGVSLWLAHGRGVQWDKVWRRVLMVGGAAGAITLATWLAMPDRFIFFGILHAITFGSLAGLAFVRRPAVAAAGAVVVLALWWGVALPLFDRPLLLWVGLGTVFPYTVDYVPMFPWFAAVLAGIAFAGLAARAGLWSVLARWRGGRLARALAWPGRHSLAVYLVHQPVLIGLIWVWVQIA